MVRALGRYELLRPLARGGMAEVYLARRRGAAGVEKRLVIKRIRPERSGDPRFLELFVREARVSMALAHQNIVPVFDFGRAGDELFLAMEHVDGRDLGALLDQGGTMEPIVAAHVASECARGLAYAHGLGDETGRPIGVVHRDVAPRNVLVSLAGEVKLVDFGVAALGGDAAGRVRGTPWYMAPEQARGEAVDGRADVYALGVVLWEALTGKKARTGDAEAALAEARAGRPLAELGPGAQRGDGVRNGAGGAGAGGAGAGAGAGAGGGGAVIPESLVAIVRRATAARAADRFAGARELHDALEAFVIAARAAHPEWPAPGRKLAQLVRGLAGAASATSDELAPAGGAADLDGPVVTFMDDGEAQIIGAYTQRSVAETLAGSEPGGASGSIAAGAGSALPPGPEGARARRSRRQRRGVATVAAVAGGGGLLAVALWPSAAPEIVELAPLGRAPPGALIGTPADATVEAPIPAHDAGPAEATPPMAAALEVDAGSGAAVRPGAGPPRPGPGPRVGRPGASADAGALAPLALRKVTINSRPWSRFSVDGGAVQHETPETVLLAPGPHRIRFVNAAARLEREIELVVPADRDLSHVESLTP